MNSQSFIKKQTLSTRSQNPKPSIDAQKIDEILWTIIDRKFDALKNEIKAEIATHLYRHSLVAKVEKASGDKLKTVETSQSRCSVSKSLIRERSWKKNLFQAKAVKVSKNAMKYKGAAKGLNKTVIDQRFKSKSMASSLSNFKPRVGNKWLNNQNTQPSNKVLANNNGTLILDQPIEDLYHSLKDRIAEKCALKPSNNNTSISQLYVNDFEPPIEEIDLNVLNHSFEDFLSVKKDSNRKAEAQTLQNSTDQATKISNYANFHHFLTSQKNKINDSTNSAAYQPTSFRNPCMETIAEQPDIVNNSMMLVEERIDEESGRSRSDPISSSNTGNSHYVFGKASRPVNYRRESIKDQFERRESLLKTTGMLFTFERKQRNSTMDLSVESKDIKNLEL